MSDSDHGRRPAEDTHTPARVLVLDRRGELSEALGHAASSLADAPEVLRLRHASRVAEVVDTRDVDVIVAAPEEASPTGLRRLAAVHRHHPRLVIVLAPNGTPISGADAARVGASDMLPWPSGPRRVKATLQRALDTAGALRAETIVVAPPAPAPSVHAALGRVITITSATGGCGKTFYATNLAGYIARATGRRVLLVDLDLQFGEVSVSLRLRPTRTIAEITEDDPTPWDERIAHAVLRHDAGYDVLCAPMDPVAADRVGPRETTEVLEAARASYDYVVVDTPPALNEVVLAAFDLSGSLIVMATMDVPSLKNLNVFLQTLARLKVPSEGVSLVLNKAESGTGIELPHVLKLFPQGFSTVLPYAREVSRSINVGMPVVFSDPDAEVSRKLIAGAETLVPRADGVDLPWDGAVRPTSWLRRLMKGVAK